jgi:hypothetical protein
MFSSDFLNFDDLKTSHQAADGAYVFTMVWDDEYYMQWEQGEHPVEVSSSSSNNWVNSSYYYSLTVCDGLTQYGQIDFGGLGLSADPGIMFDGRSSSGAYFAIGVSLNMSLMNLEDGIPGFSSLSGFRYIANNVELYVWKPDCGDWKQLLGPSESQWIPTYIPTMSPTTEPTVHPTVSSTKKSTINPTSSPTNFPTNYPPDNPSISPTSNQTVYPSNVPTKNPIDAPNVAPTNNSTVKPTAAPTHIHTDVPTTAPTLITTYYQKSSQSMPSWKPTTFSTSQSPITNPTTLNGTYSPSNYPTDNRIHNPTVRPTDKPTMTALNHTMLASEKTVTYQNGKTITLIIMTVAAMVLCILFVIITCWFFPNKRAPPNFDHNTGMGETKKDKSPNVETDSDFDFEVPKKPSKKAKNRSSPIKWLVHRLRPIIDCLYSSPKVTYLHGPS